MGAKYRRISSPRGAMRANVAVQHAILTAIWHMATNGTLDEDLDGYYSTRLNPNEPAPEPFAIWRPWATAAPHKQASRTA